MFAYTILGVQLLCWIAYSVSAFSLILSLDSYFKARKSRKETREFVDIINAYLTAAEQEKGLMPMGKGKYDDECTAIREKLNAKGIVLIVIGENPGTSSMCVQVPFETAVILPRMFRRIANEMVVEGIIAYDSDQNTQGN